MQPIPASSSHPGAAWGDHDDPPRTLCISPNPAIPGPSPATPWDRPIAAATLGTMMMPAVSMPASSPLVPAMPLPEGGAALGLGGTVVIEADALRATRARIEAALAAAPPPPAPLEPELDRADRTLVGDAGVRTMIGAVDLIARGAEPFVINAIVDAPASSRSFVSSVPPAAQYAAMVARAMPSPPPPSRARLIAIAALFAAMLAGLLALLLATR